MPTNAKEMIRMLPAYQQTRIKVRTRQLIEEALALRQLRRARKHEQNETGRSTKGKT